MGELQSLLWVLLALYGVECLAWIPLGSVALVEAWSGPWRLRHPARFAGNQDGGFRLAPLLPPPRNLLIARQFPVSLAPEGACAYVASCLNPEGRPAQSRHVVRFAALTRVEVDGKRVRVNGAFFFQAGSTYQARYVAAVLQRLRAMPQEDRAAAIQAVWAGSLDGAAIGARVREFRKRSRTLRWLSQALLAYLFGLGPLLLWGFGFRHAGGLVLAGLLAQTVSIAVLFRRAHRALYPAAEEERFTQFLIMLLAPPSAARAFDLLGRPLLEEFHPLAVVSVLGAPEVFRAFARAVVVDLRFPLLPVAPGVGPEAAAIEAWSRETGRQAIERFLRESGLDMEAWLVVPSPQEQGSRAYCPRCGAEYVTPTGVCGDCGGRDLVQFHLRSAR